MLLYVCMCIVAKLRWILTNLICILIYLHTYIYVNFYMCANVHLHIHICVYTSSCVYIKIFAWECDCSKVESLNSPHQLYSEFTQQLYAEAGAVRKTADGTDDTAENVDDSLGTALRSCHKAWLRHE